MAIETDDTVINWDTIPEDDTLDAGCYRLIIDDVNMFKADKERKTFKTYSVNFKVLQGLPGTEGRYLRVRFKVGSEADPDARDPDLINKGNTQAVRNIRNFFSTVGVNPGQFQHVGGALMACRGREVCAEVTKSEHRTEKGRWFNNVNENGWFRNGDRPLGATTISTPVFSSAGLVPTLG